MIDLCGNNNFSIFSSHYKLFKFKLLIPGHFFVKVVLLLAKLIHYFQLDFAHTEAAVN